MDKRKQLAPRRAKLAVCSHLAFAVTWDGVTGQPENLFFFRGPGRPKATSIDLQPGEGELLAAVLMQKGEGS